MSVSRNVSKTGKGAVNLDLLEVGDLLEIDRNLYQHWAVYIGGGEVVHLTSDGRSVSGCSSSGSTSSASASQGAEGKVFDKAVVKKEKLDKVLGGSSFKIDRGPSRFTPQEIKRRALRRVGECGYHVLLKNCEHFARRCRYDTHFSMQVVEAAKKAASLVTGWFQ